MKPSIERLSFDLDESDDIIGLARELVDGRHPGILGTVDQYGRPQLRWMSTLSFTDFPFFHSLTAPNSRKIDQIKHCPDVNWMFFNHDRSLVLNLLGKARVLADAKICKRIWKEVHDKEHAYFLKEYSNEGKFCVIETTVLSIECSSPQNAIRFSVPPADLQRREWDD